MSADLSIHFFQDVWVPPSNGLQAGNGWNVVVPRQKQSFNFDAAVIAHNGKCAERLTSSTPAKEVGEIHCVFGSSCI